MTPVRQSGRGKGARREGRGAHASVARVRSGMALIHGGTVVQLGPRLVERDGRWHCQRSFQLSFPQVDVDIFFMDTSAFRSSYRDAAWASFPGGLLQQSWPVSQCFPPKRGK